MRHVLLRLVCIVFGCAGLSAASADDTAETVDDFDTVLQEIGTSADIVGLAVAVVRGGEVESIRTFGVRSLEGKEPVDEDTVFRLASLSKGMAASAVGQMVQEESVSLSAPVKSFSKTLRLKSNTALEKLSPGRYPQPSDELAALCL